MSFWRTQIVPDSYFYESKSQVILNLNSWIEDNLIGRRIDEKSYEIGEEFWRLHFDARPVDIDYDGFTFSKLEISVDQGFYFAHPFDENIFKCPSCNSGFMEKDGWYDDLKKGSLIKCLECNNVADVYDIPNLEEDFGFSNLGLIIDEYSAEVSISTQRALKEIFCSEIRILYQNL